MPFDSNGNYSLPPGYFAQTGQTILASQHNPPLEDIAAGMTSTVRRNGSSPMLADLPMGGFKITGLGAATAAGDAVTKAQLDAIIALLTPTPGEISFFARATAPSGWIKANGSTIGNAASGATRSNADTSALFTTLWENFSNTVLPIYTSAAVLTTRGANAAADFSANKRLTIPDLRGEFLRAWDDARGIDPSRAIGTSQADELESHAHTGFSGLAGGHNHAPGGAMTSFIGTVAGGPLSVGGAGGTGTVTVTSDAPHHSHPVTINATGGTETRPRNLAFLACLKL